MKIDHMYINPISCKQADEGITTCILHVFFYSFVFFQSNEANRIKYEIETLSSPMRWHQQMISFVRQKVDYKSCINDLKHNGTNVHSGLYASVFL